MQTGTARARGGRVEGEAVTPNHTTYDINHGGMVDEPVCLNPALAAEKGR
jgi:hypothetical protein